MSIVQISIFYLDVQPANNYVKENEGMNKKKFGVGSSVVKVYNSVFMVSANTTKELNLSTHVKWKELVERFDQ